MKILDTPRSGKIRNEVAYLSPFGQCVRGYIIPHDPKAPAQEYMRIGFGYYSRAWRTMLTEEGRQAWIAAGGKVPTAKKLNQSGWRSGQQHLVAVNVSQFRVGEPALWTPPDPVVFGPSPVGQLTATNGENGVRLMLSVTGPVTEKIMVFGQAPCSAGRMKHRNVAYLGLLPPPKDGAVDITDIYVARYGEPKPGEKLFIVTRQQKNGWEDHDKVTNDIVPGAPELQQAPPKPTLPLKAHMYNGCTPDAQGTLQPAVPCSPEGDEPADKHEQAMKSPSDGHERDRSSGDCPATPVT